MSYVMTLAPLIMQKLRISADMETDSQAPAAGSGAAAQDAVTEATTLPALYSASHAVSKLAESSSLLHAPDRIRDVPVQVAFQKGALASGQQRVQLRWGMLQH